MGNFTGWTKNGSNISVVTSRTTAGILPHSNACDQTASFTRPAVFRGVAVPEVLLSGDHAKIESWRREHVR